MHTVKVSMDNSPIIGTQETTIKIDTPGGTVLP